MFSRIFYLLFIKPSDSDHFVKKSYDRISTGYDQAWTSHMRDLTESLINRLNPKEGDTSLDLACGTGFAANLISEKTQNRVVGIDRSEGMLIQARKNYGNNCEFVQSDVLEYLKKLLPDSVDIITCCWGLGYTKPFAVLRQIKRILKPGGKVGIIDNTLFSLREILYCSFLAFAEQPDKLTNLMRFKFLPGSGSLGVLLRLINMNFLHLSNGIRTFKVQSGQEAIDKLRATGAAAGFEYASNLEDEEQIFLRFAEIIEQKYMKNNEITISHRYLEGIAQK
jgi:ubiquinone/menaquinone biosynthesis C-methylase UbiE